MLLLKSKSSMLRGVIFSWLLLGGLTLSVVFSTQIATAQNTIPTDVLTQPDAATASRLGIDDRIFNGLLGILQQQYVPEAEWPEQLSQIAIHYKTLLSTVEEMQAGAEPLLSLRKSALQAIKEGDLEQAGILLSEIRTQSLSATPALQLTAAEADAANAARALTLLNVEEAADYYLRASTQMEALGEKHHAKWSEYADSAGSAFREAGFYTEANTLLSTAFRLREKHVPDSRLMTSSLNKLAGIKRLMGHYDKALPLAQRVLRNHELTYGNQHTQVAIALNNVADIYRLNEDYPQALPLYKRALDINRVVLGDNHPDVATTLNNLAGLYEATGANEEALALYQQALEVNEGIYGKSHPKVATTLNNLAGLYRTLGDYEKALPLYERDLSISRKTLGEDHPDVATTLNNLGILFFYMKDFVQSANYLEQALRIFRLKLGLNHPNTVSVEESLVVINNKLTASAQRSGYIK